MVELSPEKTAQFLQAQVNYYRRAAEDNGRARDRYWRMYQASEEQFLACEEHIERLEAMLCAYLDCTVDELHSLFY